MIAGTARYEFRMAIGRWGVWLAFGIAGVLVGWRAPQFIGDMVKSSGVWAAAGRVAFMTNLWMPLVAGIALADRLPRDHRLATAELLRATPVAAWQFVLGKYLGGLATVVVQVGTVVAVIAGSVVLSGVSLSFCAATVMAFVLVNLPPLVFVAAFSIACPAVIPVRVYQALFTGYWFWGNFLNPRVLPTISETALVASGLPQAQAWFGAGFGRPATPLFAAVNLVVLAICAAGVLAAAVRYHLWREAQA